MNETYTAAHTESATDLYGLRLSWLDETDIHASAYESVEERLCASLYHCANALSLDESAGESLQTENKKEPTKEADCFVFLASHVNSPKPAASAAGYDLAYQWLMKDSGKATAAEAVFSLYPEADNSRLFKLYDEQEALRPTLFSIFRKQMLSLPIDMVNAAAVAESSPAALKLEALRYAAANTDFGMDIFRTHYLPLLSGITQFDAGIVDAAIWGGMVRSDPDAIHALSVALSNTTSTKDRAKLLRLAALSGVAEFLPQLVQAAESDPDTGYPLLVLFGKKSVMPELLRALENARSMEAAANAFTQLSDQILPRIPRLTVVGEEEEDETEEDAPQIPDVKFARTWWDKHQAKWKADERWLFGKLANTAHLAAMNKKYAGSFGSDVLALLALAQKAPLNIPTEIWRTRQQQLLASSTAAQPAVKSAQPAKVRHA
jgi:hypothetical protein